MFVNHQLRFPKPLSGNDKEVSSNEVIDSVRISLVILTNMLIVLVNMETMAQELTFQRGAQSCWENGSFDIKEFHKTYYLEDQPQSW